VLHGRKPFGVKFAASIPSLHNDSAALTAQRSQTAGVNMSTNPQNGLIHLASQHSVEETMQRLEALLNQRGITIFARVDHSGEAAKVGFTMRPTRLLIFGSPKGGTPLMLAAPTLAIDLPLKALFWQDAEGKVWLTYNDPGYLQQRHNFPADLLVNLSGVSALFAKAVE
jgi:uncharacterized protein (DUF302 family)